MSNPLHDRQTQSHRTTINNVPVHRLHGHLPPPMPCPDCGYSDTWFLLDPDTVNGHTGEKGELAMTAEFRLECVNPSTRAEMGVLAMAPMCGHPYHLVAHRCSAPGEARLVAPLPAGLIVRPT